MNKLIINQLNSKILQALTAWLSDNYNNQKSPMENIIGDFENAKTKHEEIRKTIKGKGEY